MERNISSVAFPKRSKLNNSLLTTKKKLLNGENGLFVKGMDDIIKHCQVMWLFDESIEIDVSLALWPLF